MPRTSRKTTATAETPDSNVVPLHPDQAEQAPADEPAQVPEPDEQSDGEEQPERQSRGGRGPALNRVELLGRIAKGPDVRMTHSGMRLAYFRVATNGLKEQDTEYHQCTAFGRTAQFIGEYLSTGRLVYLDGRLQTRAYDDPDGVRRWAMTIVVNRLQVLDFRRRDEQAEQ